MPSMRYEYGSRERIERTRVGHRTVRVLLLRSAMLRMQAAERVLTMNGTGAMMTNDVKLLF